MGAVCGVPTVVVRSGNVVEFVIFDDEFVETSDNGVDTAAITIADVVSAAFLIRLSRTVFDMLLLPPFLFIMRLLFTLI